MNTKRVRHGHCAFWLCAILGLASPAFADPERLTVFSTLKSVEGQIVSGQASSRIDAMAQSIGFAGNPPPTFDLSLRPAIGYDANINGGQPNKPLVVGTTVFHGDPALFLKDGMVYGLNASQNTRIIYDHGRYLDLSLTGGYVHSVQYGIGKSNAAFSACSHNHIADWWYVDLCAEKAVSLTDLTRSETSSQSVSVAKYLESGPDTYSELSVGAKVSNNGSFDQDQFVLGIETVRPNGTYSALDLTLGTPETGKLATRLALAGQLSTVIGDQPVKLTGQIAQLDGGLVLGYPREDVSLSIAASFQIWQGVDATVGYAATDSTIDYYDAASPTFGLSFTSAF